VTAEVIPPFPDRPAEGFLTIHAVRWCRGVVTVAGVRVTRVTRGCGCRVAGAVQDVVRAEGRHVCVS
jgi:hypothetical protein